MDNIIDKLGLYDFFGVLIPGMTFLIILSYIDFQIVEGMLPFSSSIFQVIIFVLISYILGTLIQEIASFLDEKFTKMRIRAREQFLGNNPLFKGGELLEVKKVANKLLKKDKSNNCFTNIECSKVFYECKAYLENNGKMGKADRLDAVFAMSRDFIICNIGLLLCLIYTIRDSQWYFRHLDVVIIIYLILSSVIFYRRANRYSEIRVRTILRQYIIMKKE